MNYNLADQKQAEEAFAYLTQLVGKSSLVKITKVSPARSLKQNSYLHLIIGCFAQHFGWTVQEAKIEYKRISPEIYTYDRNGHKFLRSSADLTVEEMTLTIDKFRSISKTMGCPLPTATDLGWLREIENEIERSKYYLKTVERDNA